MTTITLIFPHQLFAAHPAVSKDRVIVLCEEWLFFSQYDFHQQKLALHRASMRYYAQHLHQAGYEVIYVAASEPHHEVRKLIAWLAAQGVKQIHACHPTDDWLERRMEYGCLQQGIKLHLVPSPNFVTDTSAAHAFFDGRKNYFQTDFYVWQRKRMRLLLKDDGQPAGGRWTYDTENRERFPKDATIPSLAWPVPDGHWEEAVKHVQEYYHHCPGQVNNQQCYPYTPAMAQQWLQQFLQTRLAQFGPYEDAMVAREEVLYHSVLTPMLNIGLLQPMQIVAETCQYASKQGIPINSLEGFLRQVVGWREFIRMVYLREGRRQRTTNYWGFSRRIPAAFYTGTTGILPVDTIIKKLLRTGYNHHIERLMVLGNFFLLCEFDPDAVYQWFMEMYVDAYDWVMVPNVYGMTQFADAGLMTTKPYISGSNYLLKMGDWPKGEWQTIWDGLFWRFMHVHRSFFLKNPRLGMLVKTFDKMPEARQQQHLGVAEKFLTELDKMQKV